ncbi:MAG TPA: alpha/beta fold hydrolase [Candidatus Sulfotelmatobacter sp.]
MMFGQYLKARRKGNATPKYEQEMEAYDRSSLANMFGGNEALLDDLLKRKTAAYLDAPPASGSFPVVVYSMGQNDHNEENAVLCEFLASHGFIVVSVPDLGPTPRRSSLIVDDPASYEGQVRDLEFALQETLKMPSADGSRVAAVGMSMGGIYALLFAMRNDRVGAIVGLDASYMEPLPRYYYKYQEAYYFNPPAIRIPLLSIFRKDEHVSQDVIAKLRYSDRVLVEVPKVIHADFTSYPLTNNAG